MSSQVVTDPGVVTSVPVDSQQPTPADCLPPGESPLVTADLSPGWIAVTDREILVYHPNRDPNVARVLRVNVTGLAVRRAGGRSLVQYVPMGVLAGVGAFVLGVVLLAVDPMSFLSVPSETPVDSMVTIIQTVGWASNLLGVVFVFTGILGLLAAVTILGYWLTSNQVAVVVERGKAAPIECPSTRANGQRALRELEETLSGEVSLPP